MKWKVLLAGCRSPQCLSVESTVRSLEQHYDVTISPSLAETHASLQMEAFDLFLCGHEIGTPPQVLELLNHARVHHPYMIPMLVGVPAPEFLREVIRKINVYQCVPYTILPEHLELELRRALETRELSRRHRLLARRLKFSEEILQIYEKERKLNDRQLNRFGNLIYRSQLMGQVCNIARRAAETEFPVLIQGETGTGKELLAQAIHEHSHNCDQQMLVQNCGGVPDEMLHSELFGHKQGAYTGAISDRLGLFAAADGATVFLDEISETSLRFQTALLRFLQEGEIKPLGSDRIRKAKVRVIAACNQPLDLLVEKGRFRKDLYYRLKGFALVMPALRERSEDIPVLASYIVQNCSKEINRRVQGASQDVMDRLCAYSWPGNVRELENELRYAVTMTPHGEFIRAEHLSPVLAELDAPLASAGKITISGNSLKEKVESLEMNLVRHSLVRNRGNQSRAASELGISRVGLANKIRRYNLHEHTH
jgi:two-component system response regulator HupR/HoxA